MDSRATRHPEHVTCSLRDEIVNHVITEFHEVIFIKEMSDLSSKLVGTRLSPQLRGELRIAPMVMDH